MTMNLNSYDMIMGQSVKLKLISQDKSFSSHNEWNNRKLLMNWQELKKKKSTIKIKSYMSRHAITGDTDTCKIMQQK